MLTINGSALNLPSTMSSLSIFTPADDHRGYSLMIMVTQVVRVAHRVREPWSKAYKPWIG